MTLRAASAMPVQAQIDLLQPSVQAASPTNGGGQEVTL